MIKVTLLGTGAPSASATRASSSYLIETGPHKILFDCGYGSLRRLIEAGRHPKELTHLVISHYHFDHFLDYPAIVMMRWDKVGGIAPDLKVFGPSPLHHMNTLLFGENGVFHGDIGARTNLSGSLAHYQRRGGNLPRPRPTVEAVEIGANQTINLDTTTKLSTLTAPHGQPYLNCLSFRLDTPEGSVVYTGDTAPHPKLCKFSEGCDILIHLCAYIEGTRSKKAARTASSQIDAAKTAQSANASCLVLTHINPSLDQPENRAQVIQDVSNIFNGKILLAEDGMSFSVSDFQ